MDRLILPTVSYLNGIFCRSLSQTGPLYGSSGAGGRPPPAGRGPRPGAARAGRVSAPVADIVEILQMQSGGALRPPGYLLLIVSSL